MKPLNKFILLTLLLSSCGISAGVYFDSESGKNIDYWESENGGILIDKKLKIKFKLSFSNKNQQTNKKLIFNYKDTINNEYKIKVDNETKKLSDNFTGIVEIETHFSNSKTKYTTKTIYSLKKGLVNGELKTFFNEHLLQIVTYNNGFANGKETIFWSNGIPAITGSWVDGYMSEKWTANYINGKKGLKWGMDKGSLKGIVQSWDISGNELTIGTIKSTTDINGKFILLYGTPIDYMYRVASPIHMIENKYKFKVSSYKNGKVLKTLNVFHKVTQQELNVLNKYINKNKSNEYATHMSSMLPVLSGQ